MGGAEPPGATRKRPLRREHGEDGEHQTFRGASTVARSAQAGGTGGEYGLSGFSPAATRSAATAAATWREGRPLVGWPGASRLFGGRCCAQPLVLHDLAKFHGLDLVELAERQRNPFELNREAAVRIVHDIDRLAYQ